MNNESIEGMLKDLLYEADIGTLRYGGEILRSFKEQFKEKKFLSDKQQRVLRRIYTEHIG